MSDTRCDAIGVQADLTGLGRSGSGKLEVWLAELLSISGLTVWSQEEESE